MNEKIKFIFAVIPIILISGIAISVFGMVLYLLYVQNAFAVLYVMAPAALTAWGLWGIGYLQTRKLKKNGK